MNLLYFHKEKISLDDTTAELLTSTHVNDGSIFHSLAYSIHQHVIEINRILIFTEENKYYGA